MTRKNPRDEGLSGSPLVTKKYRFLRAKGVPADIAKVARKLTWDKIDFTIREVQAGNAKIFDVPDYYKTSKTKARKKGVAPPQPRKQKAPPKKPAAKKKKTKHGTPKGYKKAPEGFYYAQNHKTGKYFLKKFPQKLKTKLVDDFSGCWPKLMIFYEEVVETDNGESITTHLNRMQQRSINYLKTEIGGGKFGDGWYDQNGMYIGRVAIEQAQDEREMNAALNEYAGWQILYNDCPDPKRLLAVIATIGKYVYEPDKKRNTANNILSAVEMMDPAAGNELFSLMS